MRDLELAAVDSHRIVLGQQRRRRIARLELVAVVGIDGGTESLHLPVAWHVDVMPAGSIRGRIRDIRRQVSVGVYEIELPHPVEKQVSGAVLVAAGSCCRRVRIAHEGSAGYSLFTSTVCTSCQ